jgi:endonuclease/exonuclease/phosphatase (EEP) superfamily protein YafD
MKLTLQITSFIILVAGVIPLIKKDHWTFRIFEFPRLQKLCITLFLLLIWIIGFSSYEILDYSLIICLVGLTLYLFVQIYPYTPLGKKMIQDATSESENSIHLLVANVYQENDLYDKVINLIKAEVPDVFLLVETDQEWANAIGKVFKEEYPNFIEKPQDNTYGMLFYSKLPIQNQSISYLIEDDVPSLEVDIELPDEKTVRIYAIHPTPPVPGENVRSTERDAEILLIGKKAKAYHKACIVIGDLNDVAWSYTTDLFLKTSGLLDPRRGRGMYNTFHAQYPLLRWPLDHIFISQHFVLEKLKVHREIGSDHFPISTSIQMSPQNGNQKKEADGEENEEAEEKIEIGKAAH